VAGAQSIDRRRSRRSPRRWPYVLGALLIAAVTAALGVYLLRDAGVALPGDAGPDPHDVGKTFTAAWVAGDYQTMYRQLTPQSRTAVHYPAFLHAYHRAAKLGTLQRVRVLGPGRVVGGTDTIPLILRTAQFGKLQEGLQLPLVRAGDRYQIRWSPQLAWPGLAAGESLVRDIKEPGKRGAILAGDGTVLARGPADNREYPQGAPFYTLTGFVRAPQTAAERRARVAAGWEAETPYGQGGLEESLDTALGGAPQIDLDAKNATGDTRLIARHHGRSPHNVTTTLDPDLQSAATTALGNRLGGIAIMDPRNGAVRAAAGIAMDAVQPPGSTFKIVTASAALTAHKVTLDSTYTPARFALVGGFKLVNFHHELCGGTLVQAFANSCNSVFGPVAVDTGAEQLHTTALRYGFNGKPGIAYPLKPSSVPSQATLQNPVNLGVAGIGQGGVTATPLQMASVGSVIAERGILHPPWIARRPARVHDHRPGRRVISRRVADDVAEMMRAVVSYGTGTAASSALATVNGKTGTAELGPGIKPDAWVVGYAPAEAPRVVVSVLVVHGGVGGKTAAPIAREMIDDALG
jgi:penicillin-binding protein A